jgi:predicted tellurium resistance membrane protein TerC
MLGGGLFLIYKATTEIHEKLEGAEHTEKNGGRHNNAGGDCADYLDRYCLFA